MLTDSERDRYARQILIDEIGEESQEKLKSATVCIAGAGGLGSAIAVYLTAAGIGEIRIADHDQVELSNLNRQILHWNDDIGRNKVDSAVEKLKKLNPDITLRGIGETITEHTVSRLAGGCDCIVDAMDNFPTRYMLNAFAVKNRIPFFQGAVSGFEGRVMTVVPGKTPCLECMNKGPVLREKFPVIGVAPAVIGSIQATEVIKYITGIGELLLNRLLVYDGLSMTWKELKINRNPYCKQCRTVTAEE